MINCIFIVNFQLMSRNDFIYSYYNKCIWAGYLLQVVCAVM